MQLVCIDGYFLNFSFKFSLGGVVRVRVDVRVRVRVSNLLGSDEGQCEFRVIIRVRAELELGLGLMFDPNN